RAERSLGVPPPGRVVLREVPASVPRTCAEPRLLSRIVPRGTVRTITAISGSVVALLHLAERAVDRGRDRDARHREDDVGVVVVALAIAVSHPQAGIVDLAGHEPGLRPGP